MLTQQAGPVKPDGYTPGSLDAMVRAWATRYWPDVADTWDTHRDYYGREFVKQMRADAKSGKTA